MAKFTQETKTTNQYDLRQNPQVKTDALEGSVLPAQQVKFQLCTFFWHFNIFTRASHILKSLTSGIQSFDEGFFLLLIKTFISHIK